MLRRMQKFGWRLFLVGISATAYGQVGLGADRARKPAAEPSYFATASAEIESVSASDEDFAPAKTVKARPTVTVKAKPVVEQEAREAVAVNPRPVGYASLSRRVAVEEPETPRPVGYTSLSRRVVVEEPEALPCDDLSDCDAPWWAHRSGLWAELLYVRPGGSDIVYAIEQNDVTANAFPTGPIGQVAIHEALGFRVGMAVCLSDCSSLVASYAYWNNDVTDQITRLDNNVLVSQVIHPSTVTTGAQSLQAQAAYDILFNLADLGHRSLIVGDESFALNWTAGLRYGNLQQQFRSEQTISTATGLVTVDSQIDFDGFGLMFGVDGMTYSSRTGFFSYSKALISLLAGEWKAAFRQQNQIPGGIVANNFEDFRITPQGELEVGLGWQNCSGNVRMSVGYMAAGWFNAVTMRSYIDAVHAANYHNVGQTMTFNGLVARLECAY